MELKVLLKEGAAYVRVSDERQDEYSPDSQLKKIREYAAKEGYTIPDEYVFYDDGISGKSVRKRNDFNRMIAFAKDKSHPFDKIYVWKFSRFARNQEESIVYKNLLKKKGVTVVSVSEPIPEGHFGTLIERIIEWMDEYYSINLGVEVTRGMTEKVQRGEPVCPPAFGYEIKNKNYYKNEETAPIVQEVFSRYAQGEGMRTIATDLGSRGVRTKRGNQPDNRWVEYMLHNPVYIGKLRWSLDGTRAVNRRDYFSESVLTIDGHHEPIIDMELWETVQSRLEAEKKMYPKHAKKGQPVMFMLKGLVRCSSCGGTLAMSSAKSGKAKTPTLQCCNYNHGSCRVSHSVLLPKIEEALYGALEQAVSAEAFTISPEQKKQTNQTMPDYDKLISIEEKKLDRCRQAYLAEIDSLEQYAVNKKEIESRIAELVSLKDKNTSAESQNFSVLAEKVKGVLAFIQDTEVSAEAKNIALRSIIEKVVYNKEDRNVSIYFLP